MPLASTFLAAKGLALALLSLSARIVGTPPSQGAAPSSVPGRPGAEDWRGVLDKSIGFYNKNLKWASSAYSAIFPGTLWCGQGSKAHSFEELGTFAGPDRCCRDHDHCPDSMGPQSSKHGLTNDRQFSTVLCACDHKLLHCLRADGSVVAREIGRLYFDFLEPVCFTYDYPVRGCRRREKLVGGGRCVEYEYDTSRVPEWHFEDFPFRYGNHRVDDEVDIATESAAALAGQERPDAAANGEDAELWNALLMNRHVRFGSKFGDNLSHGSLRTAVASVIGQRVFTGA